MNKPELLQPADYCGERARELDSGKIVYTKAQVKYFCDTYTYIDFNSLSKIQIELVKGKMINLFTSQKIWESNKIWDGVKLDLDIL